ncbi:DEKNAAC101869 [Brettanomyces naardenensis]|uniref:alanine--glyoxylate transaminase n=1 Tax=Brettanomyces naardenensis TaxID=13370 RepID=A0A448YIW8_BRENA|nr:DEKNAAC101869 [Brettanomyces naardenensis]
MPARKLTFIPGPIEFSDEVLQAMSTPSEAHTSPEFVAVFQEALKNTRKLFRSTDPSTQGIVISGSGTLGWDLAGANLLNKGERALVISTGFFSDSFANCLKVYAGADKVDVLKAKKFGAVVENSEIESALQKAKDDEKPYSVITITQTDTSSGVLSDVEAISAIVRRVSPDTLIVVDAVCATVCENLEFDKWGIDFTLTASQKAVGVPAGLSISFASGRAIEKALSKKEPVGFYTDLQRWIPIMRAYESGKGAYFATPSVQLVHAYRQSLREILVGPVTESFSKHKDASDHFKAKIAGLGLKFVPLTDDIAAHGLSVIYFPEGIEGPKFLSKVAGKGFTIASGIFKGYQDKYFRVGHMGISAIGSRKQELDQCFEAIKSSLEELGYKH